MRGPVGRGHNENMTPFTLREFRKPQDYAAVADVLNASNPSWPLTPELLQTWEESRDPALFNTQLVAEQGGRVVAAGGIGHDDFAFEEWRYFGNINVHPDARTQGIGTAMRQAICALLFDHLEAAEITSGAFVDNPASLAVSRKVGYRPNGILRLSRREAMAENQRLLLRPEHFVRGERDIEVEGVAAFRRSIGLESPDAGTSQG